MPAYIIQDVWTGYIWGDTRDIGGRSVNCESICDACRALDESIGETGRAYAAVSRLPGDSGYKVYRADINGSEAVAVIRDGQDRETIDSVERDCEFVGFVHYTAPRD